MLRLFVAVVALSLTGCSGGVSEAVSTTRVTSSGTWDGAHAELFTVETKSARMNGEILWPSKIQGAPPPFVILVNGAARDTTTALAMSLAESSVATLRYAHSVDDEIVSASVKILRRDPRVGRIVLLADDNGFATVNADIRIGLPRETKPSDVIDALATHALLRTERTR